MSLILRHKPEKFGLVLDREGYMPIDDLLFGIKAQNNWNNVTKEDILKVVAECPKQRYELVEGKIRARYGHSGGKRKFTEGIPPKILYHGTNTKDYPKIMKTCLSKMKRDGVHLSETTHFATLAGKRRGELVILEIDTEKARELDVKFSYAGGEVWLSEDIPVECLKKIESVD
jgi:putative RNA 2'-phosphotransferase